MLMLQDQPALFHLTGCHPPVRRLAEDDVFDHHLVDQCARRLSLGFVNTFFEEVLVDGQGVVLVYRDDLVRRDVAPTGIDIQAERRPEEVVPALTHLATALSLVRLGRTVLGGEVAVLLAVVTTEVNDVGEAGMRVRAVIALEEVLDDDLPVRLQPVFLPVTQLEAVQVHTGAGNDAGKLREIGCERLDVVVKRDENEGAVGVYPELAQPQLRRIETGLLASSRSPCQGTVQRVGPGVVMTRQRTAVPGLLELDLSSPMPAHVHHRVKVAVTGASDEHRDVSDIDAEEVTRLRDRMRRAGVKPRPAEDLGLLPPVERRVGIPRERERPRAQRSRASRRRREY